jgi:hypothetical protein
MNGFDVEGCDVSSGAVHRARSVRRRSASSAGSSKAAANLSAGSLERPRLRCSSMSSWIVAIFPLTVYTGAFKIVWKMGASYQRFLAGCVLRRVE